MISKCGERKKHFSSKYLTSQSDAQKSVEMVPTSSSLVQVRLFSWRQLFLAPCHLAVVHETVQASIQGWLVPFCWGTIFSLLSHIIQLHHVAPPFGRDALPDHVVDFAQTLLETRSMFVAVFDQPNQYTPPPKNLTVGASSHTEHECQFPESKLGDFKMTTEWLQHCVYRPQGGLSWSCSTVWV